MREKSRLPEIERAGCSLRAVVISPLDNQSRHLLAHRQPGVKIASDLGVDEAFYEKMLKEGMSPAAALRAAQVSMWRDERWEAPYQSTRGLRASLKFPRKMPDVIRRFSRGAEQAGGGINY